MKSWQSFGFFGAKTIGKLMDCDVPEVFPRTKCQPQLITLHFLPDRYGNNKDISINRSNSNFLVTRLCSICCMENKTSISLLVGTRLKTFKVKMTTRKEDTLSRSGQYALGLR